MKRIITAVIGIPILLLILLRLHPGYFLALACVAAILAALELFALAETMGFAPHKAIGAGLCAAIVYTFFDSSVESLDILVLGTGLTLAVSLLRSSTGAAGSGGGLGSTSVTLMVVLVIGLMMGFFVGLMGDGSVRGRHLVVLLFMVVWVADAVAFAVGSLWGRHPLLPAISPGKTIEGAIGGLMAAIGVSLVARSWFFHDLTMSEAITIGALLGVAGMLGDLVESMLKRAAAVKDSGGMFPGHGGMLDRTDSLLLAAPVLFYYDRYFLS